MNHLIYPEDFTDKEIKKQANKCVNLTELFYQLSYANPSKGVGSNSREKLKKIIGENVYKELSSGKRCNTPKSKWTKCKLR